MTRMGRRLAALVGAIALALSALVVGALPASAHNVLISSDPAEGDEMAESPGEVVLTFDQPVQQADVNEIAVTGPDGSTWTEGSVRVAGAKVTQKLRPLGPAGEYVVGYRVLSADGHPVSNEIRFTLTQPGPGEGSPPAQAPGADQAQAEQSSDPQDSSGVPVWVWIVGAAVLLIAGLALALRMGKQE